MAQQLDRMPGAGGRTPRGSYPWDEWLNGDKWHLRRGQDYRVKTLAMRAYVYRFAGIHGVTVSTVRDPDDQGISIHAHRPGQEP